MPEVDPPRALAQRRVQQNRELVASGAGNKFDLEQAEAHVAELRGQRDAANSALSAAAGNKSDVEQAEANVAELRGQRDAANSALAQAAATEQQSRASVGQIQQK